MITKVVHGWRVGGLLAYLMGPGRAEEHRRPRVVATWDGRDSGWQPAATGPGEWDLELGPLIRAMRAPGIGAGLPDTPGPDSPRGYVWHCSARVAVHDRVLSDAEWAEVARDLLHGAGVGRRGDKGGPRWVAVRHADDHIHIAVVLVRQDTGRRFWPRRDFPKLRVAAREIEQRLGLTLTAAADGTAPRAPGRGELEKAARTGRDAARPELARAVKAAAVAAHDVASFEAELRGAGYLVEIRFGPSGDPLGYKVARPGDVTAAGFPVFYSGSKLASDLSMPRLLRQWVGVPAGSVDAADVLVEARYAVDRARRTLTASRRGAAGVDVDEIAHATQDVLTAVRGHTLAGRDLGSVADLFDRAARIPDRRAGEQSRASVSLRWAARQLMRRRRVLPHDEVAAGVAMAIALAALLQEIAAWQRERGRAHQAAAAEASSEAARTWAAAWPPRRNTPTVAGSRVVEVDYPPDPRQPRNRTPRDRKSRQPRA
ncbi:relaxase/mobilization nuclease domain-containing protein [Pseudonocardia sp. DLS-67]